MRDFFYYLNKGELRIPTCNNCHHKIWPPRSFCSRCFSKDLELPRGCVKGRVLEFSKSYANGTHHESTFALIEISGIRLIGSVVGRRVSNDNCVIVQRCGLGKDKEPFYEFKIVEDSECQLDMKP